MHFQILVEDESGKILLESLIPKILGKESHTFDIKFYKGLGHIPKNLKGKTDPSKRILLDQLPRIIQGYGKSWKNYKDALVIVVVDCDQRDCFKFKKELLAMLEKCYVKPRVLFRLAIEEIEAWLLGDKNAIKKAYPAAKLNILDQYEQDSICGTWEKLAEALNEEGILIETLEYPIIGRKKCEWAERIGHYIDIDCNKSKSFQVFRDGIKKFI